MADRDIIFSNIRDVGGPEIGGISYAGCERRWNRVQRRGSGLSRTCWVGHHP